MALLSGSSPTQLAGTDRLTRQIDDRVEQIAAPNHPAVPMAPLGIRSAEGFLVEAVELLEPTEDETKHYLTRLDVALRTDVAALGSETGLYESSAERALTPFRLRAFPGRGSPSA